MLCKFGARNPPTRPALTSSLTVSVLQRSQSLSTLYCDGLNCGTGLCAHVRLSAVRSARARAAPIGSRARASEA